MEEKILSYLNGFYSDHSYIDILSAVKNATQKFEAHPRQELSTTPIKDYFSEPKVIQNSLSTFFSHRGVDLTSMTNLLLAHFADYCDINLDKLVSSIDEAREMVIDFLSLFTDDFVIDMEANHRTYNDIKPYWHLTIKTEI